MNTFNLNLDLDKTSGIIQWVTLRQGDKNGTELRATIYDHGTPVTGNYTARFSLRHPGTGDTYYRETATYSNGVATVTVDEQYAATVTGITAGYFELLQGSTVIASTADFGVRILASATDGAVPGEVYDSAIEDALAELDEATGHINQMVVDATEEYLNAHPELTTTVEDNSVTDAKLIQQGGILSRVDRLMYRLDNLLTATPAEAESVTVTDAAKTPVAGLALYGKSTQDGTPTPSAPVPIQSVTVAELHAGTEYGTDATGWPLIIDLQGHALRSLPEGTHDEVAVDARGHVTLIQRVGVAEIDAGQWSRSGDRYRRSMTSYGIGVGSGHYLNIYCTAYPATSNTSTSQPANTVRLGAAGDYAWLGAGSTLVGCTLIYELATPVTHDLGTVDPPLLPAPELTAWNAHGTTFTLTYERDLNMTLARLEAAIATLA